jgi:2-C-methyl-D-erythritol 4-phosphate cytidylyltransferase
VVVAAGSGSRLGADVPKAFVDLCGETLLSHAVRRVRDSGVVDEVILVVPPSPPVIMHAEHGHVVAGGPTRQASVRCGLEVLSDDVDVVLVHDSARCLAPPALIASVAAAVRAGHPAVVPGLPVVDTLRSMDGGVVDRSRLRAVQTPQGFARDVLEAAHLSAPDADATDDAGLVERTGVAVHVVPGHPEAFKITKPLDMLLARALLSDASRT